MRTGLMYAVGAQAIVTAAGDLIWELTTSADTPAILHYFLLTSDDLTDTQIRLRLRSFNAAGTGGTAQTETPLLDRNVVAADSSLVTDVDVPGGIDDDHESFSWISTQPLIWLPSPKNRIYLPTGSTIGLNNLAAVGTVAITVVWEEL